MSKISGLCPNCGSKLICEDNEQTVVCFACDSVVTVAEMTAGKTSARTSANAGFGGSYGSYGSYGAGGVAVAALMGFDNPESGVVFVENFFDNYDWEEYQKDADIAIDELEEVVYNNKMKNGAVPTAWYLDYKALAIPLRKKIEGLDALATKIGELYNPEDSTESYGFYDMYCGISARLLAEKEGMFKRLDSAIQYAVRFALDKARLSEMQADYADLQALFDAKVQIVSEISDIPAYAQAQEARDEIKRQELAQAGVDADAVYQEALEKYNGSDADKKRALTLFEKVRGYRDSIEYIEKINLFFWFGKDLYRCCGKHFILEKKTYTATLNMKQLGKDNSADQGAAQTTTALALYELVDGKPAKVPSVEGIAQLIACYGGTIYYVKEGSGLCCYDFYKKTEDVVATSDRLGQCRGKDGYEYDVIDEGRKFYIKGLKVNEIVEKGGCGSKATTRTVPAGGLNPYSLFVVDMTKNNSVKTELEGFNTIVHKFGNKVFYTREEKVTITDPFNFGGKKSGSNEKTSEGYSFGNAAPVEQPKEKSGCSSSKSSEPATTPIVANQTVLYVCDLVTGDDRPVLDINCKIKAMQGNKIVYTKLQPNDYNQDLYVYDLETYQNTLIEENVYEYFGVFKDKIYYLVGNANYCPLVRNSFDGTAREQFMKNVERIIMEIGGWLYVKKGRANSYNSSLVKVSLENKKRVVVCTQFKRLEGFYGNYIYYVDVENNLRSVRIDGKKNFCIAKDVYKVYNSQDYLYYTRNESVALKETALSLYKMDKDGDNIRKIVFNVEAVCEDKKTDKIYFRKTERTLFKCYLPKQEQLATTEVHDLRKFYALDKKTESIDHVLTLGYPSAKVEQSGCSGTKSTDKIYEEIGIQTVELMQLQASVAAAEEERMEAANNNAAGCGSTNKAPNQKSGGGCGA